MNPIWSFLSNLVAPIATLIDGVHTSEEEKLKIKAEMFKLQAEITSKVMDYESKLMDAQASVVLAEAKGDGWLQKNWRPLMMVWFAVLLGMYWFGITPPNITQETLNQLFTLIQIGIGGYIVGRSAEKIIPQVVSVLGKSKE